MNEKLTDASRFQCVKPGFRRGRRIGCVQKPGVGCLFVLAIALAQAGCRAGAVDAEMRSANQTAVTHAHLWDVGLRPIAPLLVRMTDGLNRKTRAAIKRDWVELFLELLTPLCKPDLDLWPGRDEPA